MTVGPVLHTVGLFAGVGGMERGLENAGHRTIMLVENAPTATEVLRARFPDSKLEEDVRDLLALPADTELVTAGFPCQDLSSVGQKIGIRGKRSSLVSEVFRLIDSADVPWVLLENVPFLLHLQKGHAMKLITSALAERGYHWAYRVVDSEALGLPQRRRRLFIVASRDAEPWNVLLSDEGERPDDPVWSDVACGFYWTEGMRALGWAVNAIPPLKSGSTVGVPSPPAIVFPNGEIATPDLRDAERLQGFPVDWTEPAETVAKPGFRWQLVGNSVSVPVAGWIGRKLRNPSVYDNSEDAPLKRGDRWPAAAWGTSEGEAFRSPASVYPCWVERPGLEAFLEFPTKPLSVRAACGFLKRTRKGSLRFKEGFLEAIEAHIRRQGGDVPSLPDGKRDGQLALI